MEDKKMHMNQSTIIIVRQGQSSKASIDNRRRM